MYEIPAQHEACVRRQRL
jgi:hypothetical protein